MMRGRIVHRALLAATLLFLGVAPSIADDDHDRARRALEAGEIMPLRAVIERVEADYPGQIIEVELERDDGSWLYEIKLLRSGGALVKLKIDARDGTLIGIKGRDVGRGERN
jgi:uncharacterized membrane protein YkoI